MSMSADLIGYSEDGNIQLVVEVKKAKNVSPEWVEEFRRNLLTHAIIPPSNFFLLVLPQSIYLWKNSTVSDTERRADYTLLTQDVLSPYLGDINLNTISEQSLELLTHSWLSDLANSVLTRKTSGREQSWLFDSGLYESMKNGSIRAEVHV